MKTKFTWDSEANALESQTILYIYNCRKKINTVY